MYPYDVVTVLLSADYFPHHQNAAVYTYDVWRRGWVEMLLAARGEVIDRGWDCCIVYSSELYLLRVSLTVQMMWGEYEWSREGWTVEVIDRKWDCCRYKAIYISSICVILNSSEYIFFKYYLYHRYYSLYLTLSIRYIIFPHTSCIAPCFPRINHRV